MRNTPEPSPEPAGDSPTHAVHLLAEAPASHRGAHPAVGADMAAARTSAHVRGLAAGLVARGLRVTVSGAELARGSAATSASISAGDDGTDLVSGPATGTPDRPAPGH
ncbi:hypothetical protein [Streptomyces oceani]|uniref:hypothetical protein n=1 Tax=Streptomyces oceani TaxID=1075402 RepID=UPI00087274BC|nr:hypothetical protein [Streptomyces oceani]